MSRRITQRLSGMCIAASLFLLALPAKAQTVSEAIGEMRAGTAIVVFYSKQRVVLAGESRITLVGSAVSHRDDECKLFTFKNRFLFAGLGITGHDYLPGETGEPWSAQREASRIAATVANDAADGVAILAHQWGEWMRATLDAELVKNEAQVLSHLRSVLMASGVFAGRNKAGELSLYTASLVCACNEAPKRAIVRVDKQEPTTDGLPVALLGPREGQPVFNEVLDGNTDRAKNERAAWVASLPQDNSLAHDAGVTIRTLSFVLQHSGASDLGGPIDAVALDANGKIRWIQRKPNCKAGNDK